MKMMERMKENMFDKAVDEYELNKPASSKWGGVVSGMGDLASSSSSSSSSSSWNWSGDVVDLTGSGTDNVASTMEELEWQV